MHCAFCGKEVSVEGRVGREDSCPKCHRALHCCLQCKFYDPNVHHECRESSAEFVSDKEKPNFCDYFVFHPQRQTNVHSEAEKAKKDLEDLFKKT